MHSDKKPLIIAIIGKSGSGKTTFAKALEWLGIPQIVSYTTRAKRDDEKDGVEHYFVDNSQVPSLEKTMAYTYFGGHHYWTLLSQLEHPVQTYVIDEAGLLQLESTAAGIARIMTVCIHRDNIDVDEDRQARDNERTSLEQFDCTISNNGSIKMLREQAQYFEAYYERLYELKHPEA